MTEELTTKKGRLAAALIAGPAVTAGMLGLGMAPVSADTEQEPDSAEVVEETQDETVDDGQDATEGGDQDAADGDEPVSDEDDAGSEGDEPVSEEEGAGSEEGDGEDADAEDAGELPTITVGPRDVTGQEDEFFQVTADPAPVHVIDEDGELEVIGYVAQGGVLQHSSGDLDADDDWSRISSSDGIFAEHFGVGVVYFSPSDVAAVADGAPDEDAPETDVPDADVPVLEFPPRDASDYQDEVVLVVTERAPVFETGGEWGEPIAYIAEGSIVRFTGDLERVDEAGGFVTLTDDLFERELDVESVSIRTDHITSVDDDSAVSDGPRPTPTESEAPTVDLDDPEYDGDLWNLAVVTDRAPVYGSYTEGLNDEVLAYIPAGTLIRFAHADSPEDVGEGRNPDLIGQRIMVESPELADALDTTDFFLFYVPTDFLRNANDEDVEIYDEDDEDEGEVTPPDEDESPSDGDESTPSDEDDSASSEDEGDEESASEDDGDEPVAEDESTSDAEEGVSEEGDDDDAAEDTAAGIDVELSDEGVTVTVEDSTEEEVVSTADTKTEAPAESSGEKLAETGVEARTAGTIAGAFLALGAALMAFAHRARLVRRRG
ncbi:hypothetical protein [Nesterenkonia sp. K-15-9-6]|uniref:hypothetical protein n=1 Tax=Nesterenkonia sp. K-15-9-6 TaxID=3093918 RepID=UPI0040442209